jgi:hypothetical protein
MLERAMGRASERSTANVMAVSCITDRGSISTLASQQPRDERHATLPSFVEPVPRFLVPSKRRGK